MNAKLADDLARLNRWQTAMPSTPEPAVDLGQRDMDVLAAEPLETTV